MSPCYGKKDSWDGEWSKYSIDKTLKWTKQHPHIALYTCFINKKGRFTIHGYNQEEFVGMIRNADFKILKIYPTMQYAGLVNNIFFLRNTGKNRDATGNTLLYLNPLGRAMQLIIKPFKWFTPNRALIVAESPMETIRDRYGIYLVKK